MIELEPTQALIIYEDGKYIEMCDIKNGKIQTGKPLGKKQLTQLADYASGDKLKFRGLIPKNLLYYSLQPQRLIWVIGAGIKNLFFSKNLHIGDGWGATPPLIFDATNNLNVYAFKEFKGLETVLYRAPFHNIDDDGSVCMGNSTRNKDNEYMEDEMKSWEMSFWGSKFSEVHDEPLGKQNINTFWKSMIQSETQKFPLDILVKSDKQLKDIL